MNSMHRQQNNPPSKVTHPSSSYLEARVLNLEEEYANLRGEVGTLKEKYHQLRHSDEKEKEAGEAEAQPPSETKLDKTAVELGQELEELTSRTRAFTNSEPAQKPVQSTSAKVGYSTPPHLRSASTASSKLDSRLIPPHLRKAVKPDSKVADK